MMIESEDHVVKKPISEGSGSSNNGGARRHDDIDAGGKLSASSIVMIDKNNNSNDGVIVVPPPRISDSTKTTVSSDDMHRSPLSEKKMIDNSNSSTHSQASSTSMIVHHQHQQRLYGRETQQQQLLEAIDRCSEKTELVIIRGAAGSGKSSLAKSIRSVTQERGGFWCYGKFDYSDDSSGEDTTSLPNSSRQRPSFREQPYSAFRVACQALVKELLRVKRREDSATEHGETTVQMQQHHKDGEAALSIAELLQVLDQDDLELLVTFIPTLQELLDKSQGSHARNASPDSNHSSTSKSQMTTQFFEMKQKLRSSFQRFIRSIGSMGPLVLCLDDIQWADQASLDLLEGLLSPTTPPSDGSREVASSLIVIANYRNDDTKDSNAFLQTLERVKKFHVNITTISVENLSVDHVNALLVDYLDPEDPVATMPLARCIHQKTAGNAFYVRRFLISLQTDNYVVYDATTMKWRWDVDEINKESMATENVVALLKGKLQQLPIRLFWCLPRIACIGSSIPERAFHIILDYFQEKDTEVALDSDGDSMNGEEIIAQSNPSTPTNTSLHEEVPLLTLCEQEGLLVNCGQGWYRWEHDKIREAALELVDSSQLAKIRYEVGQVLFDRLSSKELEPLLFVVTGLLNSNNHALQKNAPQRFQIAKLNLECGKKSFASSAFAAAADYLNLGISMLPDGRKRWTLYFDVTLQLFSTAAEANFCTGNFEQATQCCESVLEVDRASLLDKRRAYNVLIHTYAAQLRNLEAEKLCLWILRELGYNFPKFGRKLFTMLGLLRIQSTVEKTTDIIAKSPRMKGDDEKEWVIYLLDQLSIHSYMSAHDLLPVCAIKALKLTLRDGVNFLTSPTLATIALMLGTMGSYPGARKYADLSLKLMNHSTESRTRFINYTFTLSHQLPLKDCIEPMKAGYVAGMKSGDIESALWCAVACAEMQLTVSFPLQILVRDLSVYAQQMESVSNKQIVAFTRSLWQVAYNLSDPDSKKHIMKGDYFTPETELDLHESLVGIAYMNRMKMTLSFWFNQHEDVVRLVEMTETHLNYYEKVNHGSFSPFPLYCECALSCVSVARKRKTKKYIRMARQFLSKLLVQIRKGNPNYDQYEALINAEILSASGKSLLESRKDYELAIQLAKNKGHSSDQGIAHERYGDQLRREGSLEEARVHYKSALELYENKWGALAKAAQLRRFASPIITQLYSSG
jgi:predicted ATPase